MSVYLQSEKHHYCSIPVTLRPRRIQRVYVIALFIPVHLTLPSRAPQSKSGVDSIQNQTKLKVEKRGTMKDP